MTFPLHQTSGHWTKSVRFQLTLWYLATLTLILLAAGALLFFGLRAALLRQMDDSLLAKATQIVHLLAPTAEEEADEERQSPAQILRQSVPSVVLPGVPRETALLRLARQSDGRAVSVSPELASQPRLVSAMEELPVPKAGYPSLAFLAPSEEEQARCLSITVPETPYLLQVAAPWDSVEDLLQRLLSGIALTGLLFLALSGVGSWLLVSRALRPIDAIATEAEMLTPGHRLRPRSVSDNEIGHLVRALDRMMARLAEAFDAQRRFTADASHELRTPLTILQGEFELMLTRQRPADEYRAALSSGLVEIGRMSHIVESLSLLARADAADQRQSHAPLSLTALTRECGTAFTEIGSQKGLRLSVSLTPEEAIVDGNTDELRRLLRNLLENAVRYTMPGGEIALILTETENSWQVCVSDTGTGISAEDMPHIFTRFYRADKARVNDGGSGLGLSIAQSIAEAHGGEIRASSVPGEGSKFTLTLPKDENILISLSHGINLQSL